YTAAQSTFAVTRLQPRGGNDHAAFQVTPREAITYHYDRIPADPRVAHSFVLETGTQGEVKKSVVVAYPRAAADATAPAAVRPAQAANARVYTEPESPPDGETPAPNPLFPTYRLRVPFASRSYELTGFTPAAGRYFRRSDFGDPAATVEVPFEAVPPAGQRK